MRYNDFENEPDDLFGDTAAFSADEVNNALNAQSGNINSGNYDQVYDDYDYADDGYYDDYDSYDNYDDAYYDDYEEAPMAASRGGRSVGRSAAGRFGGSAGSARAAKPAKPVKAKKAKKDKAPKSSNGGRGGNGGNGGKGHKSGSGKGKKAIIIAIAAIIVIAIGCYVGGIVYYGSHFLPGSTIGGVDVGKMTAQEASVAVARSIDEYTLTIQPRGVEDPIELTGADVNIAQNSSINYESLIKDQSAIGWLFAGSDEKEVSVDDLATYDESRFNTWYADQAYFTNDDKVSSEIGDALFSEVDHMYHAGGIQGNRLDLVGTKDIIGTAIRALKTTLDMDESGCYQDEVLPEPTSEQVALAEELNSYVDVTVLIEIDEDHYERIDGELISECLSYDSNFNVTYDETHLREYLDDMIERYNTVGSTREFRTTGGSTIEVSGGTYGWKMSSSVKQMVLDALDGTEPEVTISQDDAFERTGYSYGDGNDIGDTYIEVNLTAQKMYVYIDGNQVLTSDIVSGDVVRNRTTPTGVYYIMSMERDRILRGDVQQDGSREYETLVHYWMKWTGGGVGFHDGYWRSRFGGNIYITNGSHGCCNMPSDKAAAMYDLVEVGMPVVSYGGDSPSNYRITGINITTSSGENSCPRGGSVTINADVQGVRVLVPSVKWVIEGATSPNTTISTYDGVLTVGEDETATTIVATCTSEQDLVTTASVSISITAPQAPAPAETSAAGESSPAT